MKELKSWLIPLLESQNCRLYELEWDTKMKPPVLRIAIERPEGEVDLDFCTSVSELISARLDETDDSDEEYILEVCSAGIDRPIVGEEFEKALEHYIQVELTEPMENRNVWEGVLKQNGDSIVLAYFDKGRPKKITIPKEKIRKAVYSVKV